MAIAEAIAIGKLGLGVLDWFTGKDDQEVAVDAARDLQKADQAFQAAERERERHHEAVTEARRRNFERERQARYARLYQGFVNRQRAARYDYNQSRAAWLRGNQDFRRRHGISEGSYDTPEIRTQDEVAARGLETTDDPVLPGGYPELDPKMEDTPPIGDKPPAHGDEAGRTAVARDRRPPEENQGGRVVKGTGYTKGGRTAEPRPDPGMDAASTLTVPPGAMIPTPPASGPPAASRVFIPQQDPAFAQDAAATAYPGLPPGHVPPPVIRQDPAMAGGGLIDLPFPQQTARVML